MAFRNRLRSSFNKLRRTFALKLVRLGLALLVLGLVSGLVTANKASADGPLGQELPEVRVVTKEIAPFVIREDGRLTGFSIDLWEDIAQQAGLNFEYVEVATVGEQLEAVGAGDADLAIAAISVTGEREEQVDFSYPYYTSGLLIMTPVWSPVSFRKLIQAVVSLVLLHTLGGLGLIMLILPHVIWLI